MRLAIKIVSGIVFSLMLFSIVAQGEETTALEPLKVSLTLRADYTDNRDSLPDGLDEETWDFYVKPRVDWLIDWERSYLDLFYAPSWRYRTDESDTQNEEEWQHDAGLRIEHSTSPGTVLRLDEKFDFTDDPAVSQEEGVVRRNSSYILNRVEVGATHMLSEGWTGDVAVRHMTKQYDEDLVADDSDEDRIDGIVKAIFQATPTLNTYGTVMYSDYSFDDSRGLERDFSSVLLAIGVEQTINPQLSVGASVGVQSQDYDDADIDVDEVPYASVWVQARTIPTTRIRGEVSHGLRDSDVYPFASQEYTDVKASVEWDVLPRVMLGVTGLYRNSDYDDAAPGAATAGDFVGIADGEEDKIIAMGEIAYKLNDRNKISLMHRYEDVDSDVSWDYTKNTTRILYGRSF
ncbi:MAG: outer membrane beta-barrel protein [Kiritimatiellae bacterium]|nr:outer membrane beta-barrel protein [Kiritimatiellia bacterium]